GAAGTVSLVDVATSAVLQTIPLGPGLTRMTATADTAFLVLASSDPQRALSSIDVSAARIDPQRTVVRTQPTGSGILDLASGIEPSVAYATTADGQLLYWELSSNTITHAV